MSTISIILFYYLPHQCIFAINYLLGLCHCICKSSIPTGWFFLLNDVKNIWKKLTSSNFIWKKMKVKNMWDENHVLRQLPSSNTDKFYRQHFKVNQLRPHAYISVKFDFYCKVMVKITRTNSPKQVYVWKLHAHLGLFKNVLPVINWFCLFHK